MGHDLVEGRALRGVRHEHAQEQGARLGGDIVGEGKRGGHNVLVQHIDIVAVRVRGVVVERQVAGEHGIQDHAARPHVDGRADVHAVLHDELRRRVARTAAARRHQVVAAGAEIVRKAKIGDDHIAVAVEEQVLELQVAVDDLFAVQVRDARDELRKEAARLALLEALLRENVVKQLATRAVLEHDADVALRLNHLVQMHNVGMAQQAQHRDLALDLAHLASIRLVLLRRRHHLALDQLDRRLLAKVAVHAQLDLAKLALAQRLQQQVVAKVHVRATRVRRKVLLRGGRRDRQVHRRDRRLVVHRNRALAHHRVGYRHERAVMVRKQPTCGSRDSRCSFFSPPICVACGLPNCGQGRVNGLHGRIRRNANQPRRPCHATHVAIPPCSGGGLSRSASSCRHRVDVFGADATSACSPCARPRTARHAMHAYLTKRCARA